MEQIGNMKLYSLDEVKDELIGKVGTPERKDELIGKVGTPERDEHERKVEEALLAYRIKSMPYRKPCQCQASDRE